MFTEAIDDYLTAIYELEAASGSASTSDLARRLAVAPSSVTGMVNKLKTLGLVTHRRYQGTQLTESGRTRALAVLRQHRLAETFLAETLGLPLEKLHQEAHKWEHALSEEVTGRLEAWLGHPAANPLGAPIPTSDGKIILHSHPPLAKVAPGQTAVVAEVSDHDPALLRHLKQMKLLPKATVRVVARQPCDGPLLIRVDGKEHSVGPEVTKHVFVRVLEVYKSEPGTELPDA
jgi:DtxR family Mn-dependent transcriptional regulator